MEAPGFLASQAALKLQRRQRWLPSPYGEPALPASGRTPWRSPQQGNRALLSLCPTPPLAARLVTRGKLQPHRVHVSLGGEEGAKCQGLARVSTSTRPWGGVAEQRGQTRACDRERLRGPFSWDVGFNALRSQRRLKRT